MVAVLRTPLTGDLAVHALKQALGLFGWGILIVLVLVASALIMRLMERATLLGLLFFPGLIAGCALGWIGRQYISVIQQYERGDRRFTAEITVFDAFVSVVVVTLMAWSPLFGTVFWIHFSGDVLHEGAAMIIAAFAVGLVYWPMGMAVAAVYGELNPIHVVQKIVQLFAPYMIVIVFMVPVLLLSRLAGALMGRATAEMLPGGFGVIPAIIVAITLIQYGAVCCMAMLGRMFREFQTPRKLTGAEWRGALITVGSSIVASVVLILVLGSGVGGGHRRDTRDGGYDRRVARNDEDRRPGPSRAELRAQREAERARREAEKANMAVMIRWESVRRRADTSFLLKHAKTEFRAAIKVANKAGDKTVAGDLQEATRLFEQAIPMLEAAMAKAKGAARRQENLHLAPFLLEQARTAFETDDKFAIEGVLCQLRYYLGDDDRLPALRRRADAVPWPDELTVDLGQGIEMDLVVIRPGTFQMGPGRPFRSRTDDKDQPMHEVTLSRPFYMACFELMREQWHAVMGDDPESREKPRLPTGHKTWDRNQEFLRRLTDRHPDYVFRMPTEAEWEYACRAGTRTTFHCGESYEVLKEYAWNEQNSGHQQKVGTRRPNAWGLYDMHGNAEEWCQDWYEKDYYKRSPELDPTGPESGTKRVARGGPAGFGPWDMTSATRYAWEPDYGTRLTATCRVVCEPRASRDFLLKVSDEVLKRRDRN